VTDRDPVSGTDNAWRRIGSIDNLTTITGVLWFDEAISYEELCERLEARLLRFDRFEQRVAGHNRLLGRPYWETVEDFDIETHVQHVALPEPQDNGTFQRFVSRLMSRVGRRQRGRVPHQPQHRRRVRADVRHVRAG
jgi:hypothetical protein